MSTVLSLQNVSKRYGGIVAVNDVSFTVQRGQFLGLMGANGAGKTTLFSLVAGNQRLTQGNIQLHGQSITGKRPDEICQLGVARTFQIVRPFRDMTVFENVYTASLFKHKEKAEQAQERARQALQSTGLEQVQDTLAGDLTLAGQKRLELARALATGGDLLLLDEIMAGLTPSEVESMLDMLRRIHQERSLTIICVEHVMRALMRLSDEIIVLHHGVMMARGRPEDIAQNPDVIRNYFGSD